MQRDNNLIQAIFGKNVVNPYKTKQLLNCFHPAPPKDSFLPEDGLHP